MALRRPPPRRKGEPTIALINIVFLMLIFFMIAGALAPPLDSRIALIDAETLEGRSPPDAAVVLADGSLLYRGDSVSAGVVVARAGDAGGVRLVPDRDLPASRLMGIASDLMAAGATEIWLITERGLP